MIIDRDKVADLYEEFLENNDTEGYLPNISKYVIDTICFIIENNDVMIEKPKYGTEWYTSVSTDLKIIKL